MPNPSSVECAEQMNAIPNKTLQKTFRAAGLSRLQRKANHIRLLSTKYGFRHTIYIQLADAMGFKSNREPFKQICERLPLETLEGLSAIEQKAFFWGTSELFPIIPNSKFMKKCKLSVKFFGTLGGGFEKKLSNH